jgi:hypothetical protein
MSPVLPAVLFALFALATAAGAYLIGAHFRGRRAGVLAALGTLAFFAALGAGMWAMLGAYVG